MKLFREIQAKQERPDEADDDEEEDADDEDEDTDEDENAEKRKVCIERTNFRHFNLYPSLSQFGRRRKTGFSISCKRQNPVS